MENLLDKIEELALIETDTYFQKEGVCLVTDEEWHKLLEEFNNMMSPISRLSENAKLTFTCRLGIKLRILRCKDIDSMEVIIKRKR